MDSKKKITTFVQVDLPHGTKKRLDRLEKKMDSIIELLRKAPPVQRRKAKALLGA